MKYFGIIDKNVAAIFQLQWKIGNISDMFLEYCVLRGIEIKTMEKTHIGMLFSNPCEMWKKYSNEGRKNSIF